MTAEGKSKRASSKKPGWLLLIATACLCISVSAWGQGNNTAIDTSPPVIEIETLDNVVADQSQVFTVQIAEDTELRDALLYHRRAGEIPFTPEPMTAIGLSGFYSATIRTDPDDLRSIEYYIQARDISGNRTISGFSFDPYVRQLSPTASAIESSDPQPAAQPVADAPTVTTSEPFYKKRWVQITLGVVAVGVIASSLGGSDGTETRVAPVNFSLE